LIWWGLALLAFACLAGGCGGSDSSGPGSTEPVGRLVDWVGCKGAMVSVAGDVPRDQDCIEYSYSHRTLNLKHINAAFNCCPEMEAYVIVSQDTIFMTEHETVGGCHCLCLYDLEYEVIHLPAATYRVIVSQEYLLEGDQPLEFTIDLRASPSGNHCVTRSHYPWTE
jgi:hypothetical protein